MSTHDISEALMLKDLNSAAKDCQSGMPQARTRYPSEEEGKWAEAGKIKKAVASIGLL